MYLHVPSTDVKNYIQAMATKNLKDIVFSHNFATHHHVPQVSLKLFHKKQLYVFDEAKNGDLVVEDFPITFEGYTYKYGRIAYVKGRDPRPVILVHHNYCGLKQFDVDQACFMARCGRNRQTNGRF